MVSQSFRKTLYEVQVCVKYSMEYYLALNGTQIVLEIIPNSTKLIANFQHDLRTYMQK